MRFLFVLSSKTTTSGLLCPIRCHYTGDRVTDRLHWNVDSSRLDGPVLF